MDPHFAIHHRKFNGMHNSYSRPVLLQGGGQDDIPRFIDALRHPFPDSSDSRRPSHEFTSQSQTEHPTQAAADAVEDSSCAKASKAGIVPHKTYDHKPLTGPALEDRRRQAQGRIAQGGWKSYIAIKAIEHMQRTVWYDMPSRVWGVRSFAREAEELGELCSDWKAIREFLDRNIHRFIAAQAMEKDFKVPNLLVQKANQTRWDGVLKYPWLRSFIRECQGQSRTTAESLLQVYKDKGDRLVAGQSVLAPALENQGGSSGGPIAATPSTMSLDISLGHVVKVPSNQTFQMTPDDRIRGRKRQRTFDDTEDLDISEPAKKIKRESTEDGFMEGQNRTQEPDTCEVATNEINDGKERVHIKGRTLTVLFHGMKHDGDDESEHVQVYVPRTSKGVTINFL